MGGVAAALHMTGFALRDWLVRAGMQESMQPTSLAFAVGLVMLTRDGDAWHVDRLRAAVLA